MIIPSKEAQNHHLSPTMTPIDTILSKLRAKPYARGYYAAVCPAHNDASPSLLFGETEQGHVWIKCLAGCSRHAVVEALALEESDLHKGEYRPLTKTIEVCDLMLDKVMLPHYLESLGIHNGSVPIGKKDGTTYERKGVVIPYYTMDGQEHERKRLRTSLKAKEGSYWSAGESLLIPYGLNRLEEARSAKYVVLVEGESDCWTLWLQKFPALGLPGAASYNTLQLEYFTDIDAVYVVQEPDGAGKKLPMNVYKRLLEQGYQGSVYALNLHDLVGSKDPNDLHKKDVQGFQTAFSEALEKASLLTLNKAASSDLPRIILGGQLREISRDALAALSEGEKANPTIFVKEGRLIQLARDEKRNPIVRPMGVAEVRNALTRTADYFRLKEKAGECFEVPVSPPKELAEDILSLDPSTWPFPPLAGVVEMPIMRPDGTILDSPGYDSATRLYYVCNDKMKKCKIPHKPTRQQVQEAVQYIHQCIGEFPYETPSDYANMFGLLLTLVTRYMYDGDVMTALINATKQGTGKSLLAQFACLLATGRPPAMTSFPEKEEETKKVIDAKVLASAPIIVFDNIKRTFQSASLDMLTTCGGWYSVRPLGKSVDIPVFVQMTVIATGNNIQLDADQARRCYQIRLVSPVSNPDEREDITIKKLLKYAAAHRSELVAALLTIARGWFVAGKPDATNKLAHSGSSFADWCNTVGGMLENAEIHGFQGNRDALKAEANSEEQQMAAFLHAWHNQFGNTYISASEVVKIIKNSAQNDENTPSHPLLATLPDYLRNAFFEKEKSVQNCTVSMTKWLAKRVKTPYGPANIMIDFRIDSVKCQKEWRVFTGGTGGTGGTLGSYAGEKNAPTSSTEKFSYTEQPSQPPVPPVPPVEEKEDRTTQNGSPSGMSEDVVALEDQQESNVPSEIAQKQGPHELKKDQNRTEKEQNQPKNGQNQPENAPRRKKVVYV